MTLYPAVVSGPGDDRGPSGRAPGAVGVVVIGRNEGARLVACLDSLAGQTHRVVYVDSGSSDGSVDTARSTGALVVELDRSVPFTAARGRNAGVKALAAMALTRSAPTGSGPTGPHRPDADLPDYIQFVDGDCTVVPGWIDTARAALDADATIALVTGWRSEMHRDASVFNQMCDIEWHRPAGEIRSCGGDMMVRASAFRAVGGFDPALIASEDEEFGLRVRATGVRAVRLPVSMTRHDAALYRVRQWWQRNVRTGHGYAEVGGMHPDHFVAERRRVWVYALMLVSVLAIEIALPNPQFTVLALFVALMVASWLRTAYWLCQTGQPGREALHHAAWYALAKIPHLQGMLVFYWRRLRGRAAELIEYK